MKKNTVGFLIGLVGFVVLGGAAGAGGMYTNGVPLAGASPYTFTIPLTGVERIPADTQLSGGVSPQTEAVTINQLKEYMFGNNGTVSATGNSTATASSGAVTINSSRGVVTTESLTTAAAGFYTLTVTNSNVLATSIVLVSVGNGTNTTVAPAVASVTPGAGTVTITITNDHASAALNGTLKVQFLVIN